MKLRSIIFWIIVLVILDQAIKVVVYNFFLDNHFEIIPSLLDFEPKFNVKHSWVNVLLNEHFNFHIGKLPHVLLYLVIGALIPLYLFYLRNMIPRNTKFVDLATIFLLAGIVCALSGNIIWKNGTLDYVYLVSFFVFDLKDLYPDIALVLLFTYAVKNWKQLNSLNTNIKHVFAHARQRFKGINDI